MSLQSFEKGITSLRYGVPNAFWSFQLTEVWGFRVAPGRRNGLVREKKNCRKGQRTVGSVGGVHARRRKPLDQMFGNDSRVGELSPWSLSSWRAKLRRSCSIALEPDFRKWRTFVGEPVRIGRSKTEDPEWFIAMV